MCNWLLRYMYHNLCIKTTIWKFVKIRYIYFFVHTPGMFLNHFRNYMPLKNDKLMLPLFKKKSLKSKGLYPTCADLEGGSGDPDPPWNLQSLISPILLEMKKLVIFHICALPQLNVKVGPPLEKFSGSAPALYIFYEHYPPLPPNPRSKFTLLRSEINHIVKLDNWYPEILSFALFKHNTHVTYVTSTQQKGFCNNRTYATVKKRVNNWKNDNIFRTGLNIQNY